MQHLLRICTGIPRRNPFYTLTSPLYREIYAVVMECSLTESNLTFRRSIEAFNSVCRTLVQVFILAWNIAFSLHIKSYPIN